MTETQGLRRMPVEGTKKNVEDTRRVSVEKSKMRSTQIKSATPTGENAWCTYPQDRIEAPGSKLKRVG